MSGLTRTLALAPGGSAGPATKQGGRAGPWCLEPNPPRCRCVACPAHALAARRGTGAECPATLGMPDRGRLDMLDSVRSIPECWAGKR